MDLFMKTSRPQTGEKSTPKIVPWIEKYRPKKMSEISSQDEAVCVLRNIIESANLPHLLFYGPPGTGKTSTILALSRELYGPELFKSRVLELNASDERGINVIREKVKNFARTALSAPAKGYPSPPYKIIILDEADSMTSDAQAALRRTMEAYSKITRFCLICNLVSKIIDPLASRCAKFRFKPVDQGAMESRLALICASENVECGPDEIKQLIHVSGGDLRRAIMYLQTAARIHSNSRVERSTLFEIAGVVPPEETDKLLAVAGTKNFDQIDKAVRAVVRQGYSASKLINSIQQKIIDSVELTSLQKAKVCIELGSLDKNLIDGANEHIIILLLISKIALIVS